MKPHRSGAYPVTSKDLEPDEDPGRSTDPPENGRPKKRATFPPDAPFWAQFLKWTWESGSVKWGLEKVGIPTILLGLVCAAGWSLAREWRHDTREDQQAQLAQGETLGRAMLEVVKSVERIEKTVSDESEKTRDTLEEIKAVISKRR